MERRKSGKLKLIKPNIVEPVVKVYLGEKYQFDITTSLEFYDVRCQVKRLGIENCQIEYDGERYNVNKYGKFVGKHPDGLYDLEDSYLNELIFGD